MEIINYFQEYKKVINKRLNELVSQYNVSETLKNAMEYSLSAGGKRIRPLITLSIIHDANEAFVNNQCYIDLACAVEFIHTYSLIHDDLPAMDNSDYRRGNLTNHRVYGDGMAILAGDGLLTEAFNIISHLDLEDSVKLNCIKALSTLAGANGMVGGQALDIMNNEISTIDELEAINYHKTHDLFLASFLFGAYSIHLDLTSINKLYDCVKYFGFSFQINDDLNDILASSVETGKDENKDEKNNKVTYPKVLGIEESRNLSLEYANKALEIASEIFGEGLLTKLIKTTLIM